MHRLMSLSLLLCMILLAACESDPPKTPFADIPLEQADAGSGEKLFQQAHDIAPACSTCHSLDGTANVGPSLEGISNRAGSRVNGQSAEEYLYLSIVRPSKFIVAGYSNLMYAEYENHLDPADIADIIAFLLTLN